MLILTLLLQTLVAVSVFAAPSPGMRGPSRISRHEELIEQATSSEPGAFHSLNWAGAIISDPGAEWNTVSSIFTLPSIVDPVGLRAAYISYNISPPLCNTATVKSGLDIEIKNGVTSYFAWNKYTPTGYYSTYTDWQAGNTYTDVGNFSAGDEIELTVEAIGRLETWATDVTKIWSGVKGPWFIR
ncbi:hypothetical protein B0H11DRAFT_2357058 [Mycena galericulata]|nr:hypothetical protein B0H11DRAFT_2357058 [Mycena galericulata]